MQHLDEGTIHAWLDGELPFDESSRVTAHAESCDRCTALIAEARGFVAASSRILRNLDHVPGGVIPPAANGESAEHTGFTPRDWGIVLPVARPPITRRWIPSRFAAAAAVTILAVGTYTVLNRSTAPELSQARLPVVADTAPSAAAELVDSAAFSTSQARALTDAAAQGPRAAVPPPAPASPVERVAAKRAASADADLAANRAEAKEDRAVVPPPSAVPPATVGALQSAKAVPARTVVDSVSAKSLARARDSRFDSAVRVVREETQAEPRKVLAVSPDSAIESERRRLVGETRSRLGPVVTTGTAAEGGSRQRVAALTVTTAIGCYDLERGSAAVEAGVPSSVRLTNLRVRVGSRTLRAATPLGDGGGGGDGRWYWSLGSGSLVLHQVVGGAVRFEGPVAAARREC